MNKKEEHKIFTTALKKHGLARRVRKLVEEMGELQQAVCKHLEAMEDKSSPNGNAETNFKVRDEIADVEITLAIIKLSFGIDSVNVRREIKLERLKKKLFPDSYTGQTDTFAIAKMGAFMTEKDRKEQKAQDRATQRVIDKLAPPPKKKSPVSKKSSKKKK